ncbi:helicase/secretion neighborhood CpaE-like protein [Frankia sp. EI5c]|uniref:septum site-determining protein Ssd n=1 Tax=Frankia sp. EI5c TaxID=683316 RepID=UPI0007C36B43|nr:septum site-determining protein Ssd [Frankia sp. EI5c]OAA27054.1 helicase/secretion neighborhood CpaE-like protein [Frankia sp. EI5c]
MTPAKPTTSADDTPRGRPLVVTDSPDLLDDLLRLAAAAGAAVTVVPTARAATRYWDKAPLVVVGVDRAAACVAADLPARSDIVLVGTDVDDRRTWSLALLINAEHVVFLPAAETWLVNLLSRAADTARRRSRTVGVLGGRGGTGSTTLAVTLARAGLRRQVRSVLLEIDPFGGLTVGPGRPAAGMRHLRGPGGPPGGRTRGTPLPDDTVDTLDTDDTLDRFLAGPPLLGGDLPVLSWDRDEIPTLSPPAVSALFSTARGSADLIVADLPRSTDAAADVSLFLCDTVLVVVTAERAAAAAAARVGAYAARVCSDVRLVVRLPPPGAVPAGHPTADRAFPGPESRRRAGGSVPAALARKVATEVGLPLAGVIHHEPAANPEAMAGQGRHRPARAGGHAPTTVRKPGVSRSDPTDGITTPGSVDDDSAGPGRTIGASIIQFSDLFLAELGLTGGEDR